MAFFYSFPKSVKKLDQKILYLLNNIEESSVWNIESHAKQVMGWMGKATVIRFENLVGEKGGGSRKLQEEEIYRIANALSIQLDEEHLNKVREEMWGETWTFRKGQIGDWKKWFNKEHKEVFKEKMGDLLISLGYETNNDW